MWLLALFLACDAEPAPEAHDTGVPGASDSGDGARDTASDTGDTVDTDDTASDTADDTARDTGDDTGEPLLAERFDVVVVGAGPAGVAAALAAREAGARVLLLDRDEDPGAGLLTAGQAFAVGTRWQEAVGIVDSIDAAQADWAEITAADPDAAGVLDFLANSADTLDWLAGYGLAVSSVHADRDAGVTPRVHSLDWGAIGGARGLYAAFDGELRVGVEVHAPVMEDGAVVGVTWTDVVTGETGATGAGAVVIATGGFLRDREEVDRVLPEVAGRELVFEANYQSDGGGLPFLDAVGAGRISPENIGIYVHSIRDPMLEEGESILLAGPGTGILVDAAGERFVNEEIGRSFDLFDALPAGDVYVVLAGPLVTSLQLMRPAYNWASFDAPEIVAIDSLLDLTDDIVRAESAEEAALAAGVEVDGLLATLDDWNAAFAAGAADPFGRDLFAAGPLDGDDWVIARLTPGLAKNFGGVATDADGRVLDADGTPIPGLYAAGEVAGMVLGGGGGDGFSGSVTACYWGGRVSGTEAAAFAAVGE